MRYLHQEAETICDYIRSRTLVVRKFDKDNPSPSSVLDMSIIQETLKKSETLWGGSLPYYLLISKSGEGDVLTLAEAVSKVEASSSEDEFVVVAYPDGGLISVSGVTLAFQRGADFANWAGLNVRRWGY